MKKLILLISLIFFISACAPAFQPVTSLEELMPKEEMKKKKDWVKDTSGGVTAATTAGATLVLLPLALAVIAFTPKTKELTVSEIADVAAAAIYNFNGAYILYSARDGGGGDVTRVVVIGKGKQNDGEIKPFALYFFRYKDRVIYYEVGVVKKENNGDYYYWKIPLLKKKGDAIVYSLDESLKLKKDIPSLGFENRMDLIFEKDSSFEEVYKNKHSVILEIKDYFLKNNPQMIKIKIKEPKEEKEGTDIVKKAGE